MSLPEFAQQFVAPFKSARRNTIFAALEEFCADLHQKGLSGELWLDGSFLTEKPDPNDLDGVLVVHHEMYDTFPPMALDFADGMVASADKIQDVLDMFLCIYYPPNDERAALDPVDGYVKLFGSQNDGRWLKGFAVIRIGLANVGF